jgi:hypothetical protein
VPVIKIKDSPKYSKKWQETDSVFLHRSQISIGTELINYGRLYHGTLWRVIEIKNISSGGRTTRVTTIKSIHDIVVLCRVGSNETTQLGFVYLSYSAIWRLNV